jgi:hypothetical protein
MSKVKKEKAQHLRFSCHVSNRLNKITIGQMEDVSAEKSPIEELYRPNGRRKVLKRVR